MERCEFEALVEQAVNRLPRAFREKLTNVAIIVEDFPPEEEETEGLLLACFTASSARRRASFSPVRQIGFFFPSETSRRSVLTMRRGAGPP